ncbi:hypothetical protein CXF71_11915 [Colwellia sp. 12G3]|nr:hypothetical protein CXF71_11915 [Colwellia sp. 12G3]
MAFAPSSLILTNYFLPVNRALAIHKELHELCCKYKERYLESRSCLFFYLARLYGYSLCNGSF